MISVHDRSNDGDHSNKERHPYGNKKNAHQPPSCGDGENVSVAYSGHCTYGPPKSVKEIVHIGVDAVFYYVEKVGKTKGKQVSNKEEVN